MVLRVACDLLPFNDPPQRIASIRQKPKNQRPENQSNRLLEVLTRVTIFSPTISMKARDKNPLTPLVKLQGIRRNSDQRTKSHALYRRVSGGPDRDPVRGGCGPGAAVGYRPARRLR